MSDEFKELIPYFVGVFLAGLLMGAMINTPKRILKPIQIFDKTVWCSDE